ncbi:MAG: hypothetical protein AAFX81_12225 [Pseudomonadota bacterium]
MVTKTERILDLLPRTFLARPTDSPLGSLVSTFGTELQQAENALVAVMRAHWADQADRGAPAIDDLARIAALYGLAPREDDSVEAFRARLKLWVKIILDGPASVRNLLRATSAILGVAIDDGNDAFDPWWTRPGRTLATTVSDSRDAAALVFGFGEARSVGVDAAPAVLRGRVTLAETVDLSAGANLAIALDGGPHVIVDVAAGAPDATAVPVVDVIAAIDTALGPGTAQAEGGRISLVSPAPGSSASIHLADVTDDAALPLMGLPARQATGTSARAARYDSPVDLAAGADLTDRRYVRLDVDGTLAEIDCAAGAPGVVTLDIVREAINAEFSSAVASHDGARLSLVSPTVGVGGRINFLKPAGQDATAILFGAVPTSVVGADDAPARIVGNRDLGRGVDLSERSVLVVTVDGGAPRAMDCAGADPALTQLPELVATINAAAGVTIAAQNGRNLIVQGVTRGAAGALAIGFSGDDDASELLLGLPPRTARGSDAQTARIEAAVGSAAPFDMWARSRLSLALDRAAPVIIDLALGAADRAAVTGAEIAAAINDTVGQMIASAPDGRLTLQSLEAGSFGSLVIAPITITSRRHYVSRVAIAEDAAMAVLGVSAARATGRVATAARIVGSRRLGRGADLTGGRHIGISIDGAQTVDVDCAGPRPRATTLQEAADNINAALGAEVAAAEGEFLALTSPTTGSASRILLSAPRATDAARLLLGTGEAQIRGSDATRPSFLGLADLSAGVDLSTDAFLRLAVDDGAPVDIDCAGPEPAVTLPAQVAIRINVAMGVNVASHDGARLTLTTPKAGSGAVLEILAPAAGDATRAILGIDPDRRYQGEAATGARIAAPDALGSGVDLSVRRFLSLSVDGGDAVAVDLTAATEDPTSTPLGDIVAAINDQAGVPVATDEGGKLVLTSPITGSASRLAIVPTTGGDARDALLGAGQSESVGGAASPAEIIGTVALAGGVDLSAGAVLPIVTNSGRSDVNVAGEDPEATAADEIVAAINGVGRATASVTAEGFLRISAPIDEPERLEVPARRHFELEEYLPSPTTLTRTLRHGESIRPRNRGVGDASLQVSFHAPCGTYAPGLVDIAHGWEVRYVAPLCAGETVTFAPGTDGGIEARLLDAEGVTRPADMAHVLAAPLLPHLRVEEGVGRRTAPGCDGRRGITLSAADAPERVVLYQRGGAGCDLVSLSLASGIPASAPGVVAGKLARVEGSTQLVDQADEPLARLTVEVPDDVAEGTVLAAIGVVDGATTPQTVTPRRLLPVVDLTVSRDAAVDAPGVQMAVENVVLASDAEAGPLSLETRLAAAPDPLARARTLTAASALRLDRGTSEWFYVEAKVSRFGEASFGTSRFAGPPAFGDGIFDVSRFAEQPPAAVQATLAEHPPRETPTTSVTLTWRSAEPGTALVVLPEDLPRRYGARFGTDRFALPATAPIELAGVVFEPSTDADFIVDRIAADATASCLLEATVVDTVRIGFEPIDVPFFTPVGLSGGRRDRAAKLFLSAAGLPGFLLLEAIAPGRFGNDIAVVVCDAAPGRYDVLVSFAGARFESARAVVAGPDPPGFTDALLAAGPKGVRHLKAGGVRIDVTRHGIHGTPASPDTATYEGAP